ncbi:MAG: Fic family protein [Candidatus Gracilibacteria bacterium]|nr:Fic family protein [Candidatus Gracilibacteria bacterium]
MELSLEIIKDILIDSLTPKFEDKISKSNGDYEKAKQGFLGHIEILSKFLYEYYDTKNILEIGLFRNFHKLFYPENFKILVSRNGIIYENLPGEWRKQEYNPQIETLKFTKNPQNVEKDLIKLIKDFNLIENKKENDILKFFFDFIDIHPFGDSNGTIASIIMDLELLKYGFTPLNLLKLRFNDRQFICFIFEYYQKNINKIRIFDEIISIIKDFHNETLSEEMLNEKNKQTIFSTSTLVDTQKNIECYLAESYLLAETTYGSENYPIGSILLVDGNLKIEGQNKVITQKDPSWHAEIDIIKQSEKYRGKEYKKILFVTLEPCNNCAKALCEYGVDEVYYILEDPSWGGKDILERAGIKVRQIKFRYEEYLDLMIEFMQNHGGYNEVLNQYISIKKTGQNTYGEIVEKTILENFLKIHEETPYSDIRNAIHNNVLPYLRISLLRNPIDKHDRILGGYIDEIEKTISFYKKSAEEISFVFKEDLIKKFQPSFEKEGKQDLTRQVMVNIFSPYFLAKSPEIQEKFRAGFEQHMDIMTKHSMDEYINNQKGLTIDYIREIHKNIYQGLTRVAVKTTGGEPEYVIPGEFKTKQNVIPRMNAGEEHFMCMAPEKVEGALQVLLTSLYDGNEDIYTKVIRFFLTFTEIHPFPDDNGKIGLMLVDLILIKHGIYPFFMTWFKSRNKWRFYEMLQEYSHGTAKNLAPFYTMIEESYAYLYEQKRMEDFYKEGPEFFTDFLKNTDEKKVLSEKITHFLKTKYPKTSLIISDIGAGNGIIAKDIIQYVRSTHRPFQYNYLEPSHTLIEHFAQDFDCKGVVFYEGNIEYATLPKSDFIILSHVLQYIEDIEGVLTKLLTTLTPGGTLLIVQPSIESKEMLLKEKIGIRYSTSIERTFPILQKIQESFSYERVESSIYHMEDIQNLNENGKKMISFFYNRPFDIIKDEEVERIQNVVKELGVTDCLKKEEDYIWVEKPYR